jgi:hypothetical protein
VGFLRNIGFLSTAAALLLLSCHAGMAKDDAVRATEHQVKAGFIYNFTKLTVWPASAFDSKSAPLVIGVFGDDPVTEYLATATLDRTAHGRTIRITRCRNIEEALVCHVLFIALSERENFSTLLNAIRGKPILTISEIDRFLTAGGIIQLLKEPNARIQFDADRGAAKRGGIKLSSQLLTLAKTVRKETVK